MEFYLLKNQYISWPIVDLNSASTVIINCMISRKLFLFSGFLLSGIASLVKSSSR